MNQTLHAGRPPARAAGAPAAPGPLDVAFVGSVVPTAMGTTHAFSPAGNKFQVNLVDHLARSAGASVETFTVRPLAAFPGDRVVGYGGGRATLDDTGAGARLVPFVNVRGLKEATVAASLMGHLARWATAHRARGPRALLVYNLFSPLALPVLATARAWRVPAVAVVADLPFIYSFRGVKGVLERVDFQAQLAMLRRFDGLVVLTRHIAEDHAPGVPWMLMEGAVPAGERAAPADAPADDGPAPGERVAMYSGMLNEMNGIPLLLEAFDRLREPGWRLWIYGGGPLQGAVEAAARRDPRIEYHAWDRVPAAEVRRRQRQATVLVNPRPSGERVNRYTFPSKLMEYLASGTATVSTAIPGIPEEYHPYLELARDETPDGLAQAIRRAAGRPDGERQARGAAAREWVLREKGWERQAERIGVFLRGLARPRLVRGGG
ncbi:glycosyltransferase [Longimicrobium sp.]|uniref:glycosyltransferase n=1 Tax=Longimicrobium sp. TaxID=2029185 RepID=UPI002E37D62F|nr:glycosyltransferase [Longimicrobium sp.]HEX6041628.1 glycosyltransferase [Longimicrobium sp.]